MNHRWTEEDVERVLMARQQRSAPAPKSKYGNVKTLVEGIVFDSKREAAYWSELRLRELVGDLWDLKRQVEFPLTCPSVDGSASIVAVYRADYTYTDTSGVHVVDAKGKRTQMYALKKKWLALQSGIEIEEV